ncbi:hypothetical protein, partial [Klebsiella oxytoca]|uniref:hypothetical protein n=3 Tax=Klebsiella oxytoca TaxID=571 RepID=UPI001CC9D953
GINGMDENNLTFHGYFLPYNAVQAGALLSLYSIPEEWRAYRFNATMLFLSVCGMNDEKDGTGWRAASPDRVRAG